MTTESFKDASLWRDALTQNAWDTGRERERERAFPDKLIAEISQLVLFTIVLNDIFCQGAGAGLFLTYATFMRRDQGAVKLGTVTPVVNNLVRSVQKDRDKKEGTTKQYK